MPGLWYRETIEIAQKSLYVIFSLEDLLEAIPAIQETQTKASTPATKKRTKASTPAIQETQVKASTPATKKRTKASTPAIQETQTKALMPTTEKTAQPKTEANTAKKLPNDPDLTSLLIQAMTDVMREANLEWILAARLGNRIKLVASQFDAKTCGQKNLQSLCKARPDLFEWRTKGTHLEVRLK